MKFAERRPILPWRVTNIFVILDVRSLTVVSRSRQSRKVAAYSGIGAYQTCTYGKEFPCEQNSGDVSRIVITIDQAYINAVTTIQA